MRNILVPVKSDCDHRGNCWIGKGRGCEPVTVPMPDENLDRRPSLADDVSENRRLGLAPAYFAPG